MNTMDTVNAMKNKRKKRKIRLGVNIDHCATLRQVRGGETAYPNLFTLTERAVQGGADQITIHLREDRRHIQDADLALLGVKRLVPLNLEMAATPEMLNKALRHGPDWVCLVPEKRQELTTEGGLNVVNEARKLGLLVKKLKHRGIRVSMFINPDLEQVRWSARLTADAVEFHTGTWVRSQGRKKEKEWQRLRQAALVAHHLGLSIHAGHGLDYRSARQIKKLPYLVEVNIGHFLICEALDVGLKKAVAKMVQCLK